MSSAVWGSMYRKTQSGAGAGAEAGISDAMQAAGRAKPLRRAPRGGVESTVSHK